MVTDRDKKVRREIANSNERRRMQSINAGFQGLRSLLPHHEGEKLSKAAILQQTAEYIYSLEREKTRLLSQNVQLKRLLSLGGSSGSPPSVVLEDSTSGASATAAIASLKRRRDNEADETALQLLKERQLRIELEAKLRSAECELSSSRSALDKIASSRGVSRSKSPSSLKVQVEPLNKSNASERIVSTDPNGQRSYIVTTNNSRQNLDSIVEAIRHLEGDHLFSSSPTEENSPSRVVKEEVVESESLESENTKISSSKSSSNSSNCNSVSSSSSSIALPSRPSPITVSGSSNFVILKQELKSP
eukprot:TRINITY_DN22970_c0_g1_i1.p1 TRINITY_DN22970_c0_g1~~TRINITY_DN22970_c0_g1_i1.p1  ORF type:complete len:304 (-),score=95.88 TRINITY_DN22970_c0_g1_i1:559-1470(-)